MNQRYWRRLSLAARWRLPPAEAREVLADYQDMFSQDERSEEELRRDLGSPVQAVQVLTQPKAYRRWLVVFWALAACLLLPALYVLPISVNVVLAFFGTGLCRNFESAAWPLMAAGLALSLVWFRRQGPRTGPFPKKILPLLAVGLAGVACVWGMIWLCLARTSDLPLYFHPLDGWLSWLVFILALLGVFALVKARMDDRRWRAVYILGLTAAVLWLSQLSMLHSINLEFSGYWQMPFLRHYILLTAVGLVGAGASLC